MRNLAQQSYIEFVRRTTLDIDEDMLAKAREILGTRGVKDTVDEALREVVRGEAGMGKSALLQAARRRAVDHGLATLMTAGFQSEAHIAFAGLHRLLRPVLGSLDRLPGPQRAAIQAAFGLREAAAPDLFLIALASLDLLSEMAAAAPLLLMIDDAQLLDVATCNVLTFVARRLELEPIVMLFAVRDGSAPWIDQAELPELRLQPLNDASSAAVLDANAPGLESGLRRRILAEAPPRFALAGHSMGGYIAFEIMRQAPERVAKLALLDTAATPETPQQTATRKTRIALAKSGRFDEALDLMFPALVHRDRHGDERLKRIVDLMGEETGADAFIRQQHAIMGRADSRPSLATVACLALVMVGDADELTPPAAAQEIAAGISGARLVVIPQCGHLSTLERPDAVNAALIEWISD